MSALRGLVAAAAAAVVAMPFVPQATAAGCRDTDELRNRWTAISPPKGSPLTALAQLDGGACTLVGLDAAGTVHRSVNGGDTWTALGAAPVKTGWLYAESGAPDTVLLAAEDGRGPGLYVSSDRGATFTAASGVADARVGYLAASPTDRSTLLAAVSAPPTQPPGPVPVPLPVPLPGAGASTVTSLLKSTDGGRSWGPVPGSSAFAAVAVAFDAERAGTVYAAAGGAAGGVWVSTNGGDSFTRSVTVNARDVLAVRLKGGGSELYVATDKGISVSRDYAVTFDTKLPSVAATSLRGERGQPDSLMIGTGDKVLRSTDTAKSAHAVSRGLPAQCAAGPLSTAPQAAPTTFFLRCGSSAWFRYRSDGADFGAPDDAGSSGLPGATSGRPVPMKVLKTLPQKIRGDGGSGSIAFDGDYLYYSNVSEKGVLHRTSVTTGEPGPDLETGISQFLAYLAYDARRHHMLALYLDSSSQAQLLDIDLRSGAVSQRPGPVVPPTQVDGEATAFGGIGSFSFDASTNHFFVTGDHGLKVHEFDATGTYVQSCVVPIPTGLGMDPGGSSITVSTPGIASVVASGDGSLYVELEDDSSLLRVDRACHLLGVFGHEQYPEAGQENDAIACDTVSFPGIAALWLRDGYSSPAKFTAYQIPSGYCALPSTLTLHKTAIASPRDGARVCATLRRTGTGAPIGGEQVDLFVAERFIGQARTNSSGVACRAYLPIPRELPALAKPGTKAGIAAHGLVSSFVGTIAYRPSSARGTLDVRGLVAGFVPVPPAPLPPPPPAAVVVAPPPPGPPPPPQPPAPPAGQPQPIAQGHPGAQPGAMGAPGGAMAPEDEVEVQAQGADTGIDNFSELAAPPVGIFAAGGLLGVVVWQRRRRSRVVSAPC